MVEAHMVTLTPFFGFGCIFIDFCSFSLVRALDNAQAKGPTMSRHPAVHDDSYTQATVSYHSLGLPRLADVPLRPLFTPFDTEANVGNALLLFRRLFASSFFHSPPLFLTPFPS